MKKYHSFGVVVLVLMVSLGLNVYLLSTRPSRGSTGDAGQQAGQLYTCGMHPDVISDEPGACPICGMNLVPLGGPVPTEGHPGERRIAYWVAPMDPNYISDKPGKSPMGMDLVPVYDDELRSGVVRIDPVTLQNIGVTTVVAERRDLYVSLRTNGVVTVAEDAEYRVSPKISGWIEKLHISRTGDLVRKDDPLLEIYSPELVAAQEEYLLAVKSARTLEYSGIESVSSGARDLLESARRRLELWDISADQIENLDRTERIQRTLTLHSPADGFVLHKNAVEGAAVQPGTNLFRIADLDPIWVEAQIFEHELPWVHSGDRVEVHSPYDPGFPLIGRVDYVYPYIDAKSRTATVRIILPNPDLKLRPDMYVDARIITSPRENALAIPKSSVIRSGQRDVVFVALGQGQFLPREVRIGVEAGYYFEVLEGLSPGTAIVTSAQFLLDSEASLQEAIQRRLQQRRQVSGGEEMSIEPVSKQPENHIHKH